MKSLTLITCAALSFAGVAHDPWSHHACQAELISYELPSGWQVQGELSLKKSGDLTAPYPAYVLIAGAEPATLAGVSNPPSSYAFSETPGPWFMVLVETGKLAAPSPGKAYELAPEGEASLQRAAGLDPTTVSLTTPADVSSGGLRGSQDRSEVRVPGAGDIEMDEVVYVEGHTVWMTMVGCTVTCYNANAFIISQVINNVNVGNAAR